ncbi:MAG: Glu/Leu/Phe/Val dehydrogenase dimerization domain-containing protein [Solirubrobacteraceae bacterium]
MEALFPGTEQLVLCHDPEVGLRAVIAIDDTTLGPGLGGVRMKAYPSDLAAATEARRLAAAMTLKNAAADLPFGGGKSVILLDGPIEDRDALLRSFGRFVQRCGGAYLPGVDMGTNVEDLAVIGETADDVACADEDPSPWTALGVYAALRRAVLHGDDRTDLDGVVVAVQGVGHVGADLARRLAADGVRLLLADIDGARAERLAAELGGQAVPADAIITAECDVLAPCAAARVIDATTVDRLRCRFVAGAANDVLASPTLAGTLAARGVVVVPDFLANAGGVIQIHALREGWSRDALERAVLAIGDRVEHALVDAAATGRTPVDSAERHARTRIAAAGDRSGAPRASHPTPA